MGGLWLKRWLLVVSAAPGPWLKGCERAAAVELTQHERETDRTGKRRDNKQEGQVLKKQQTWEKLIKVERKRKWGREKDGESEEEMERWGRKAAKRKMRSGTKWHWDKKKTLKREGRRQITVILKLSPPCNQGQPSTQARGEEVLTLLFPPHWAGVLLWFW